ncbi:MAG: SLC13 family permease [Chloroflexota bacterium]
MDLPGIATLALLGIAIALFISGRLRADLVALLVLVTLAVTGIITPQEAFSGFSRSAVITILAVFILTGGLYRTGATRTLSRSLLRLAGGRTGHRLVVIIMLAGATLSLLMNTIVAAAVLLPAVMGISRQTRIPPSKLLIPLAYATLLGGMATLLTTVNILVSTGLRDQGLAPFGLFDFAPVGVPIALAGIVYMALLGLNLLPQRSTTEHLARLRRMRTDLAELYGLRENLFEVRVRPDSPLGGRRLAESGLSERLKLNVVAVIRDGSRQLAPSPNMVLQPDDTLLVEGPSGVVGELTRHGLILAKEPGAEGEELTSDEVVLTEVALSPHADVIGKTLKDIRFREKFGLSVLAIWREGQPLRVGLSDIPLHFGDALLVQGRRERLDVLRTDPDFLVLEEGDVEGIRPGKALVSVVIMGLALALAALNVLPLAEATLAGAVLMVLSGCLTMDEVYQSIEWSAIFLIAGILPLGIAMTKTGAAAQLSTWLIGPLAPLGPLAVVAGLFALTAGLTQVMSGVATVVVMTPIALSAAAGLHANPHAFAMAVALAGSTAFLTPMGHPVNVLVMGPGGYSFRDYVRVGLPLTVLTFIVMLIVLPIAWPLGG